MIQRLPKPGLIIPCRGVQRPLWPFAVNRDSPQAEGLQNWWVSLGDGTLYDLAGGKHATPVGSPAFAAEDQMIQALDYGAGNQVVGTVYNNAGDDDSFTFALSPFSLACWYWVPDDASNGGMIAKYTNPYEYDFGTFKVGPLTYFVVYDFTAVALVARSGPAPTAGQWHSLVGTYSGGTADSSITIWADGVRIDTTNAGSGAFVSMRNTSAPLQLGGSPGAANGLFATLGRLADLRLYTRDLSTTPALIAQLYDPRTRWELYYPLRQRVFSFPPSVGGPFPHYIRRQMSGGMLPMSGGL